MQFHFTNVGEQSSLFSKVVPGGNILSCFSLFKIVIILKAFRITGCVSTQSILVGSETPCMSMVVFVRELGELREPKNLVFLTDVSNWSRLSSLIYCLEVRAFFAFTTLPSRLLPSPLLTSFLGLPLLLVEVMKTSSVSAFCEEYSIF